jgi:hypothetical protein
LLLGLGRRRRDEEKNYYRKGNKQDGERQESQPKEAPHTRGVTGSHIVVVAAFVQLYGMPSAQQLAYKQLPH